MNGMELSQLILGLESAGWSGEQINNFLLWVATGEECYRPKENPLGVNRTEGAEADPQETEDNDSELWRSIARKAMAYDLLNLLKAENKTYTYEDLKQIICAYVNG